MSIIDRIDAVSRARAEIAKARDPSVDVEDLTRHWSTFNTRMLIDLVAAGTWTPEDVRKHVAWWEAEVAGPVEQADERAVA